MISKIYISLTQKLEYAKLMLVEGYINKQIQDISIGYILLERQ